jgi:HAE1 family hydrophobic/amphiphilic exporter-1
LTWVRSPSESWRENQQPVITVSAELGKQDLGTVHRKLQAALAKLDVKNGIILIEYIGQLRRSGLPLEEALICAGRTRFRPILMTGLTTIFGLLPLACGFGPGAQMQQPLAVAVIGGLLVNTLLTRLLIPVGYLVLRRQ